MSSRWADSAEDAAEEAQRKAAKDLKKLQKAERKKHEAQAVQLAKERAQIEDDRPAKRLKTSGSRDSNGGGGEEEETTHHLRRPPTWSWQPCRSIAEYDVLNAIEEGSYGHVLRARHKSSQEIVAIKRLKMDPIRDGGFPVTALREIQCLQVAKHRHVIDLKDVLADDQDVYLVMAFIEHDLKSLQEEMEEPFTLSEVKTLILQLTSAVEFLHDHWILHRDLKTSNILMNNRGELKIADFGMARLCGEPPPRNLTQLVVTLWYRAPELLLGAKVYGPAVDMWSVGCILGELLLKTPVLQGRTEIDQTNKVFELCGAPSDDNWPEYKRLPNARHLTHFHTHGDRFSKTFSMLSEAGIALVRGLLMLDPARRLSAAATISHAYFAEVPRPKPAVMFPTFPSKAGQEKRRRHASPRAPAREDVPD